MRDIIKKGMQKIEGEMDILIIGNGFDLAHGLKTSYKDFLDYCENLDFDDNFRNNLWLKYFWEITKNNKVIGGTWIDFETEIYNQIRKLSSVVKGTFQVYISNASPAHRIVSIDSYFKSINYENVVHMPDTALKTTTEKINFIYSQLRNFTKAFENYLSKNINTQLADSTNAKYMLKLPVVTQTEPIKLRIISFNYTNTCEKIYNSSFRIKTIYVHGKAIANSQDCNIVLGTHSFDRSGVDKDLSMDLNIFQKHNQRQKYGTIDAYQDLLVELTNSLKIIHPIFHVFGHSLDETDHNILKHIFTANKNAKRINIYYHDEEAQEKLITNITNIIGEAEVMTKVRLIHQHDEKRGLLIPINK